MDGGTVLKKSVGNILKCNCDATIFKWRVALVWVVSYVIAMVISWVALHKIYMEFCQLRKA